MNKKLFVSIIAVVALVAVFATLFVGCNPLKWESVGGGEPNADVESNGGYFVKQGKYVYFINGYDTAETIDNTFGVPVKNSIVRAEIAADGSYTNAVVVVPKQIQGGFAIFGQWIYYATNNNDLDKTGTASTTHTDFMRSKIDGSATQLIATIGTRSANYLFTESRILLYSGTTVHYIDHSAMKDNGSSMSAAGVVSGTLVENAASVVWDINSDYIYFTQTETGDTSYEALNTMKSIKVDGTEEKVLADKLTYLEESEKENYTDFFTTKVFSYKLISMQIEGDSAVLYYAKSNKIAGKEETAGLFVNKVKFGADFDKSQEKTLTTSTAYATIYPISYNDGALVTINSKIYLANSAEGIVTESTPVIGRAVTVQKILDGVVYYTDSTGGKVYAINIDGTSNEKVVAEVKFNSSWLSPEFVELNNQLVFVFFDSNDYNYIHTANLLSGEIVKETEMLGIMNDADKEAKEKAETEKK